MSERSAAKKDSVTKIPTKIPKDLFVSLSAEEYCAQVVGQRLKARQEKHGAEAKPFGFGENDSLNLIAAETTLESQTKTPSFPPPENSSALFSDPARGAASIVALLVIGIACYSTYFGA